MGSNRDHEVDIAPRDCPGGEHRLGERSALEPVDFFDGVEHCGIRRTGCILDECESIARHAGGVSFYGKGTRGERERFKTAHDAVIIVCNRTCDERNYI